MEAETGFNVRDAPSLTAAGDLISTETEIKLDSNPNVVGVDVAVWPRLFL